MCGCVSVCVCRMERPDCSHRLTPHNHTNVLAVIGHCFQQPLRQQVRTQENLQRRYHRQQANHTFSSGATFASNRAKAEREVERERSRERSRERERDTHTHTHRHAPPLVQRHAASRAIRVQSSGSGCAAQHKSISDRGEGVKRLLPGAGERM